MKSNIWVDWEWDNSENFQKFRTKLTQQGRRGVNNRPLFEMYERRFRRYWLDVFDTQNASGTGRWADIDTFYANWKGHNTVGILTGEMLESLTGGKGYYKRITKYTVSMGQQKGAAPHTQYFRDGRKKRNMGISDKEKRLWQDMAKRYYGTIVQNVVNPNAKRKSVKLPSGDLLIVDSQGNPRVRNAAGEFINKFREQHELAKAMRRGRGSERDAESGG